MTCCAPPTRHKEARASSRLDVLEMLDARVVRVGAETVLFIVDGTEDIVANALDRKNSDDTLKAEVNRVDGEVPRLETVCERNPDKVAKGKHHAKPISDEIDGRKDRRFHIQGIEGVNGLSCGDKNDRVSDTAVVAILLHDESKVHDDPAQHTRAQLAPGFDVNLTENGKHNTRVQLAADEPVIENIARVATRSQLAHVGVLGVLDAEGTDVDISSQEIGNQNVSGEDANVVVGNERPDSPVGAIYNGSSAQYSHGEDCRAEG